MTRAVRVRVVSRIFAPEVAAAAFRLRALADALMGIGAVVDVLTTRAPRGLAAADGLLRVRRWPVLRDAAGNVRGYIQYMTFDIPVFFRMLIRRADLTIVEPPPTTGLVVRVVCAIQRRPYVYYAGDVWSDGAASMGAPALVVRVLKAMETWALRGAARVLCISDEVATRVCEMGIPVDSCIVVGNGVDTEVFDTAVVPVSAGSEFVYTGTMSEWQGAEVFILALATVREHYPNVRLTFLGQGSAQESLRELAQATCPGAVDFTGVVPPAECARWLRAAKVALVSIKPGIGYDFAKPTKIYAAAACGTPVVFAGVGAGQELVLSAGLGWARGYEVDAVAAAMVAALELDAQAAAETGRRCHAWAQDHASLQAQGAVTARQLLTVAS